MTKSRDKTYRGISPVRDEDGKIIAFLVRRKRDKKVHQVYVGVATHKTVEAAFAHAEEVRDGHDQKFGEKYVAGVSSDTLSRATKRSSTKIRGVAHCHYTHPVTDAVYESFQASWPTIHGKMAVKKVSIGERSKEDALRIAKRAREDGVRKYLQDLQSLR